MQSTIMQSIDIDHLYQTYLKSRTVTTDSRAITPGCIFFAFKGEKFDGNAFIPQAMEQGAALCVGGDKALETFDAKLYLASYANLNMGVAAGKVAQELCAIERNRASGGRCGGDIPTCGTDSGSEGQRPPTGRRAERRATPQTGK